MASTRVKVLFLLIILIICNAQEQLIHVKPDSCPQECSCSYQFPDCQTLSEYALNTRSDLPSKFILTHGLYYLDSDFSHINGTSTESFSLNGTENTTYHLLTTKCHFIVQWFDKCNYSECAWPFFRAVKVIFLVSA